MNERTKKEQELKSSYEKMVISCQSGSKKSWRKYGKKVYVLRKELGYTIEPWMENYFGRII